MSDADQTLATVDAARASASSGTLQFEPHAAVKAAQACEQMIASLLQIQETAESLTNVKGCDGFSSSEALAERLGKAVGEAGGNSGDDSFLGIVQQHKEKLAHLRDMYIKAGKAFQEANDDNTVNLDNIKATITSVNINTGEKKTREEEIPEGTLLPYSAPAIR